MIPSYLRDTGERLSLLSESLSAVVSEFLQAPATPLMPTIRRQANSAFDPEDGPAFDCHPIDEKNSVRIMIPAATVDVLCPIIFGGAVKEQALRTAAGQGLASKMAETILVEGVFAFDFPSLSTPPEDPLCEMPLLCIDYRFDIEGKGELVVTAAFTRPLTDQLSREPDRIADETVTGAKFQVKAIATEQLLPIDDMDNWEPGTIVPLSHASTEHIKLVAFGPDSRTPFAVGELGVDNGRRCLRLSHVGIDESDIVAAPSPAVAPVGDGDAAFEMPEFEAPALDDPEFEAPEFEAPAFDPDAIAAEGLDEEESDDPDAVAAG